MLAQAPCYTQSLPCAFIRPALDLPSAGASSISCSFARMMRACVRACLHHSLYTVADLPSAGASPISCPFAYSSAHAMPIRVFERACDAHSRIRARMRGCLLASFIIFRHVFAMCTRRSGLRQSDPDIIYSFAHICVHAFACMHHPLAHLLCATAYTLNPKPLP